MTSRIQFDGRTTDTAEADSMMRSVRGEFRFQELNADPANRFSFAVDQTGDERLAVSRYEIGGTWVCGGGFELFCVVSLFGGSYDWQIGDDRASAAGAPLLIRPGDALWCRAESTVQTNVHITPDDLRDVARQVYGVEEIDLRFASPKPIDTAHGEYWLALTRFTDDAIESGAFESDLVRATLTRNLAVGMLECFPLVGNRAERALSVEGQARRFGRAVQFMEENASLPITVDDVAAAAGVAAGDLDRLFRARTMISAAAYLNRVRLSAAHADLLLTDPAAAASAVRDVAHRWGFARVSDFVRRYEEQYGRRPVDTIRL